MIIVYTLAYNAEKTLRCAVDSVLGQTYKDICYYLVDNGSNDSTRKIILEYAEKDPRIVPILCEKNSFIYHLDHPLIAWLEEMMYKYPEDYFITLDADDVFDTSCLNYLLEFVKEHDLDFASCGARQVDTNSGEVLGTRCVDESKIMSENEDFSNEFYDYYRFMRSIWPKLFKMSLMRECKITRLRDEFKTVAYGGDTLFMLECLSVSNRVGILNKVLYTYYVTPKSFSSVFDDKRINSDRILFTRARLFLMDKVGYISKLNNAFLFGVYCSALKDTLQVVLASNLPQSECVENIYDMICCQETAAMIKSNAFLDVQDSLFLRIKEYLTRILVKEKCYGFEKIACIFGVLEYIPDISPSMKTERYFAICCKIREYIVKKSLVNNYIEQIVKEEELLAGHSAEFLAHYRDIVGSILSQDLPAALELIQGVLTRGEEVPDHLALEFITLGLHLSGALELQDYYLFFLKLQITLLLDSGLKDQAKKQLADWDILLPEDEEFQQLRKQVGKR